MGAPGGVDLSGRGGAQRRLVAVYETRVEPGCGQGGCLSRDVGCGLVVQRRHLHQVVCSVQDLVVGEGGLQGECVQQAGRGIGC